MKKELQILVVEDSEDDTLLEIQQVKKGGYTVSYERVETASDFNQFLRKKSWDIILADYAMPNFNGLEALALLNESGLDIPFIIISGTIGEEVAVEAMKAGAQDYIMKDNLKRLLPAIERELGEAEGRAERRLLEEKKQRAEEALRESENRYRRITESLTDYSYSVSIVGKKVVKIKQGIACETITGYSPEEFLTDPYLWSKIVVPEDKDQEKDRMDQILQGIEVPPIEHRIIRKDGSIRWVSDTTILIRNEQDQLTGYDGVIKDITDRKESEEALRLSEDRFSRIFLLGPVAAAITRVSDYVFVDVNDVFIKESGYTRDEIIGYTPLDLNLYVDLDERERFLQMVQKNGKMENFEFRFREKSGKIRFGILSATLMNLGGEMHLLTLIQDITERKKAEEELRKLSQAVEQSPVSVAITNIHGEIEYVNPKFTEITGYSKEEAIGQNPRILKSGEMPAEKHTQLWQTISSGKAWFGEFQNTKKNGESYWEMASISPIVDPAGNITHYLVIKEDITDRKLYEKALLDSERKYRVVADNTYNWEFWSDTEGNYIYCSPSCIRITGYSAQEFIDNQKLRIEIVHPDYKTEFSNHILNENTSTKGSSTQFKIIHKNGTIRWIEHICQPVFDNNDNYLGQRGSNRDITDNKETERRILKAIISTEEKERNIFSQDLHDGLGPMLSTIKLYFEWLAETKDADKRKRITKTSLDNINDAIQAVRDISNKLSPRILNNLGLISAMKNLIQKLNKTQKIKINLSFDIERRYNTQLEVTLYRIFSELINNTLKYADAQNIEIKITHDIENERIFVVYNDDGKGFNLEDVMKPNKGLGIQNIKQRIKTLDGKIIFDTDYGKPLSVNIELPIANMNNE